MWGGGLDGRPHLLFLSGSCLEHYIEKNSQAKYIIMGKDDDGYMSFLLLL